MFASVVAARQLLDSVAGSFDVCASGDVEAARLLDELGAIRRVVDGMIGRVAKRLADSDAEAAGKVARSLGVGVGEVRGAIETAKKLEQLPATDQAVREGRLSGREAQLIAGAAATNPGAEADLLRVAEQGLVPLRDACVQARAEVEDPAARAKRLHRQRELRYGTDADGMLAGRFRLTPEVGGFFKAALEAQVQRIFRARQAGAEHESNAAYAADALADFVVGEDAARERAASEAETDGETNATSDDADSSGTSGAAQPEPAASQVAKGSYATVHILIDHGALVRGGAVDGEVCEIPGVGPVDVAWVRELLGSAFLTAVIKHGKDIRTVAHLGRHVPAEVMTALIVSGRECDVEGCHHRGYLERDHVHGHARGGPTSFANLCWLCYRHHRKKSAGWNLGPPQPNTGKRTLRPPTRPPTERAA